MIFIAYAYSATAQKRCASFQYEMNRSKNGQAPETIKQFQNWLEHHTKNANATTRTNSGPVTIPIVVHIIHYGEAIGVGRNLSVDQVLSQIEVLNNDFNRSNMDTTLTPTEFKAASSGMSISFVLAKQDPNGLATNGVTRIFGEKSSWSITDDIVLKSHSYWPAEDYLNIWVADLAGVWLGYTQMPVSSTIQGLSTPKDRLTDGVVIDYRAFGTNHQSRANDFFLLPEYNLGRTTTHEVGHFFGLRHTWGDVESCNPAISTDFVDDTPIQDTDFQDQCPSVAQVHCQGRAMYCNYMNYTDDACMNSFTKGQVARMTTVLENCPRRQSLIYSNGLKQPPSLNAVVYGGNGSPIKIFFNLPSTESVSIQVYDLMGRNVFDESLHDIKNETYTVDIPENQRGVFIVRVQVAGRAFSYKVLIN